MSGCVHMSPDSSTFTLPLRTVSLSNSREHWRRKAERTTTERLTVKACWPRTCRALLPGEGATVTLIRVAPRMLDTDNLQSSNKAVRDQIAALLGIDDRTRLVEWVYLQRRGGKGEYAVEVKVVYGEWPNGQACPPWSDGSHAHGGSR